MICALCLNLIASRNNIVVIEDAVTTSAGFDRGLKQELAHADCWKNVRRALTGKKDVNGIRRG